MQSYREYREAAPSIANPDGGSSGRRLAIAGAFTGIVIIAMLIRNESAEVAIIGGAALFGLAYLVEAINHSPLLIARTIAKIDQQTQLALHPPAQVMQPARITAAEDVQPPALPEPDYPPNFVPAIKPPNRQTLTDAKTWLLQLWLTNSHLNPERVLPESSKSPGKLQWKLPTNRDAVQYLLDVRIIEREQYGYRYIGPPTLPEAVNILNSGVARPTLAGYSTAPSLPPTQGGYRGA